MHINEKGLPCMHGSDSDRNDNEEVNSGSETENDVEM